MIYGNIQLVKHTDETDPDVPEDENTENPMRVWWNARRKAQYLSLLKAAGSYDNAKESERDCSQRTATGLPLPNSFLTDTIPYIRLPVRTGKGLCRTLRSLFLPMGKHTAIS